ncbi:acetyltransferase [Bacteroidia bacterium]|nr:acetyltransferase [Bacteroidia bacterium]
MSEMSIETDIKGLWRSCFDDTEEFIDFYFRHKFKPDNCAVMYQGGRLCSSLLMLPYTMDFYGIYLPVSYISGACTLQAERGKGLMGRLLADALKTMQERNIAFSILIPESVRLYDYYGKFDYVPIFRHRFDNLHVETGHAPSLSNDVETGHAPSLLNELHTYMNVQMRKRPFSVQHDAKDFFSILEDLRLSGGQLFTSRSATSQINGMAFALPEQNSVFIYELLADNHEAETALIQVAAKFWHQQNVRCKKTVNEKAGNETSEQGGMLRIVSASTVLNEYAATHPNVSMEFQLSDDLLPANNGVYKLAKGKCTHTRNSGECACNTFFNEGARSTDMMTINELTNLLFPHAGYISLMLE